MTCQLPADCLNEIFEYLDDDKINLHSCLLVNRLWCEMAIRILWRNVWNCKYNDGFHGIYLTRVSLAIIRTLITCLPNESKELLYNNGIFIAPPTRKPSLFNYASFCKVLSIHGIDQMIQCVLKSTDSQNINEDKHIISKELLKMFMKQISSLKSLEYDSYNVANIMFTHFPGANNCLTELTELNCSSNITPGFFYQMSQICHNIHSLNISLENNISNGLAELIYSQNNLKSITLRSQSEDTEIYGTRAIMSSLTKFSSTLSKLIIVESYIPSLSTFITGFTNLQELIISFSDLSVDFSQLQNVSFPQLKVLNFLYEYPNAEYAEALIKFLEINGKTLTEFNVGNNNYYYNNSLNLVIPKFCQNLKILSIILMNDELEILKDILNNCQYLESIKVWCGDDYLSEKELFNIIAKYSPKNFHELKISYMNYTRDYTTYHYFTDLEILPESLESVFIIWKNRASQKPLSLIVFKNFERINLENDEYMKIIEKYKKLGIIKKAEIKKFDEEEYI